MIYGKYPNVEKLSEKMSFFKDAIKLYHEYGVQDMDERVKRLEDTIDQMMMEMENASVSAEIEANEPHDLETIQKLRPNGPRKMVRPNGAEFIDRLEGALYGRMIGCTLGATVEGFPKHMMEAWADAIGQDFPPTNYWLKSIKPDQPRYQVNVWDDYTLSKIKCVPADDDIAYTLLGMLIAEEYGIDFTVNDVGEAWVKHLPHDDWVYTAEKIALANLIKGVPAMDAGGTNNPNCQWIGGDIRCDGYGYIAAGNPELAAKMAYTDCYISHRRNGVYGSMFFAAAIAAGFCTDDPIEALKIGLTEIPKDCALAVEIRWALEAGKDIKNHKDAFNTVTERYQGMSFIHTINNAVLSVFGIMIGARENDYTKAISETVAMSYDCDCTAATTGSVMGAVMGKKSIPEYWYENFNNKVMSYFNDCKEFAIDDVVKRFAKLSDKVNGVN